MGAVFHCDDQGRLQKLRGQSALNAIDFLEVVDGEDVPDGLRQRVLLVRFLYAASVDTLTAEHATVKGGVRVPDPSVAWVVRLSDLDPAAVVSDPAERVHLGQLKDAAVADGSADEVLVVMLGEYGDHSAYTFALSEGSGPPAGFDLVHSSIEFGFKVECPSPFDCQEDTSCAIEPEEEPELDYLARDYKSFRQLMFDRLALTSPSDTSQEPALLRTTIVETLAYAADRLAYFQDAVATEAYLDTARRRPSVRRHARALDYPMHEGCNARTFVHLELAGGVTLAGDLLTTWAPATAHDPPGRGAAFYTRLPKGGHVLDPADATTAATAGAAGFEAMLGPSAFSSAHNELELYTWGNGSCCLPKGATEAYLAHTDALSLASGDFLVLEQTRGGEQNLEQDADPSARYVVRLVEVTDAVEDTLFPGTFVTRVRWHAEDALPADLWITDGDLPLAVARGNLVVVDHGSTEEEELTLRPWGNQGGLYAVLSRAGLTWHEPLGGEESGDEERMSAAALLSQDPTGAEPRVELAGDDATWYPERDLLSTPASTPAFVVEMEENGTARLRFGDDTLGLRPAYDGDALTAVSTWTATYRTGNGAAGDVGAEAIYHLVADDARVDAALSAAVVSVRNPVPAAGGTEPESLDEVKRYAPVAFRVQERAVTTDDWIDVAERNDLVQRAVADLRWTGSWTTVFVTVDPVAGTTFDDISEDLEAELGAYRLAGYDLQLVEPEYVPIRVELTVCVDEDHFREDVEATLYEEFGTGALADGRRGFFHPDEFSFGDSVWVSQVLARCMDVTGVEWVDITSDRNDHHFHRWGRPQGSEVDDGRIRIDRLEIARCDNDPSAPDNGRIRFYMEGGA